MVKLGLQSCYERVEFMEIHVGEYGGNLSPYKSFMQTLSAPRRMK
jgi:hypothetical protein